jgi:DNA-binding GntR family transcriptional regulator
VTGQSKVEEPVAGRSFAEQAYLAIRDRLVMLDIRPGEPINEDELANVLGFGRTPIREALKRLENERLVVAYHRRGTFATEVNISDLGHISEVRRNLEPFAASAAAERATAADRAALASLLEELEAGHASVDSGDLLRMDLKLHRAIYNCVQNPFLTETLIRYDNLAARIWCVFLPRLSGMAGHVNEHGPLLKAVIAGDASRAADLTLGHVVGFEQAIRALT